MKKTESKVSLLKAYVDGQLEKGQRKRIEAMMTSDAEIREMYTLMNSLKEESDAIARSHVEGATSQLAARMFREYEKGRQLKGKAYGITIFDSKYLPLPEGVRPASVEARKIKYRAGGFIVDISLYPVSSDVYEMIGQVSGCEPDASVTVTVRNKGVKLESELDEYQVFRFARVPALKCRMSLKVKRRIVAVIDLQL